MDIITKINRAEKSISVKGAPKGVSKKEDNAITLLYIADSNKGFPFDSLPPLFFVTHGGNNNKILVSEITGKSCRKLSEDRQVKPINAKLDLGKPVKIRLSEAKPGDCIYHDEILYLVISRPEKEKDSCIWAVPLDGDEGRTFENDWIMKEVFKNTRVYLEASLQ